MEKFTNLTSTAVPLPIENIDTDQIIPARFLKAIDKKGFGKNLFYDWRFHKDGSVNDDFVLNDDSYYGKILVAGRNLGCGSSREHAAWALRDYGFSVVISSYFADIFKENALNNGLLPVEVSSEFLEWLFNAIAKNRKATLTVNLEEQSVQLNDPKITETFEINPYKKMCLLNGFDDIDYLVGIREQVASFEKESSR